MGWTNVLRRVALVTATLSGIGAGGQWAAAQSTAPAPPPAASQPNGTVPPASAPPATPAPAPDAGTPAAQTPAAQTPAAQAPAAQAPSAQAPGTQAPAEGAPGGTAPPSPSGSGATTPPAPAAPSGSNDAGSAAPSTAAPPPGAPGSDATGPADKTVPDTSVSQTIELQPRPAIMLTGQSTWDEGFKSLNDSFNKLNDALGKNNMHGVGNPMAVFTETDDSGFKYSAMIPVDKAPEGKPDVPADVSFGTTPGGKVMRFQHRSAYDDIDSTYEAITAYLDEKGIEAKNVFAEEYLTRTKSPEDPSLEVDIDVFLK